MYAQFDKAHKITFRRSFLFPVGFWGRTVAKAHAPWLWHYRSFFGSQALYLPPSPNAGATIPWRMQYAVLRVVHPAVVSFVIGLDAAVPWWCATRAIVVSLISLAVAAFVVVVQPERLRVMNVFRGTSLVCAAWMAVAKSTSKLATVEAVAGALALTVSVLSAVTAFLNSQREARWAKKFAAFATAERTAAAADASLTRGEADDALPDPAAPLLRPPSLSYGDDTRAGGAALGDGVEMARVHRTQHVAVTNPLQRGTL